MRPDSYRPINLLMALTKLWEKSLLLSIAGFLDINADQFAYQAGRG